LKFLLRCINSVRSFFVSHSSFPSNYDELILQFLSHFKKTVQKAAQQGQEAVDEMSQVMDEIDRGNDRVVEQIHASNEEIRLAVNVIREIESKTKMINDIAFQSKILSFNASVEAARAEEHGKGFAVVAKEMGTLAEISGQSAKEISEIVRHGVSSVESVIVSNIAKIESMIENSKSLASSGAEKSHKCKDVLGQIVFNVGRVEEQAQQIAAAAQQQIAGFESMKASVHSLQEALGETATDALNGITIAETLMASVETVQRISAQFSLKKKQVLEQKGLSVIPARAPIRLGMSAASTGAVAAQGYGMKVGAQAYFGKVNQQGGVHGRKVELVHLDDGYDPVKADANTRDLLDRQKVFALFGYVGTATAASALKVITNSDVPFIAPLTGAQKLRVPIDENIFNLRASYIDEAEMMIEYIVSDLNLKKVAVLLQDDAYGSAGEVGVQKALAKRGLSIQAKGIYTRQTKDVELAFKVLRAAKPDVIVMVGTAAACGAFATKCKEGALGTKLFSLSFVGASSFMEMAGTFGEGVYISQVVPSPWDKSLPIVEDYQADMQRQGESSYSYSSLEGYIAAKVVYEALQKVGPHLSRENFAKALSSIVQNLDGVDVDLSLEGRSKPRQVWLTRIERGVLKPVA
jgi:ABC-type branched-subunit amino acid transport system substrate-binding protein